MPLFMLIKKVKLTIHWKLNIKKLNVFYKNISSNYKKGERFETKTALLLKNFTLQKSTKALLKVKTLILKKKMMAEI